MENKYKIWDSVSKCPIYGVTIFDLIFENGNIQYNYGYVEELKRDFIVPVEIQQYIGREDYNHCEIYEGDIVEYVVCGDDCGDKTQLTGYVVYDELNCAWGISEKFGADPTEYFHESSVVKVSVVGNIVRDKGLL